MTTLGQLSVIICYLAVGSSLLSMLMPQKRTSKIFLFVLGLFVISSIGISILNFAENFSLPTETEDTLPAPREYGADYTDIVAQNTADNVVEAMNTLLEEEGIHPTDIQITLKISDEGRIYVREAVIYISEEYEDRVQEIESIIYRNLSKEPKIYVTK